MEAAKGSTTYLLPIGVEVSQVHRKQLAFAMLSYQLDPDVKINLSYNAA